MPKQILHNCRPDPDPGPGEHPAAAQGAVGHEKARCRDPLRLSDCPGDALRGPPKPPIVRVQVPQGDRRPRPVPEHPPRVAAATARISARAARELKGN